MKKAFVIFSAIVSGFFVFTGCASQKIEVIQSCDTFSEGTVYRWGGSKFDCRLYRRGGSHYLESRLLDTYPDDVKHTFVKYLGENIVPDQGGLYLGDDGRMHIKYLDSDGKTHDASVPFGNIYGDKHTSLIPRPKELPSGPFSEKYGVAGVTKEKEHIIDEFLPTLQKHLRNDDVDSLSKMLIYPCRINDVWVEDRQDFARYYPRFFTKVSKDDLLKLQNEDVFCNCYGMMINYGMWFCLGNDGKAYFYAISFIHY